MQVKKFVNSPVASNSYIIYTLNQKECIIIDPGTKDAHDIISFLEEQDLEPSYVILSHEHFDHVWGVNTLKHKYSNCKIVCSAICASKLAIPQNYFNLLYYNDDSYYDVKDIDIVFTESYNLIWAGHNIQLLYTPGHTDGSICIYIDQVLFSGDTLIFQTKPLLKKKYGASLIDYCETLKMLLNLPECTVVLPGHGDSFKIGEVKDWYEQLYLKLL